MAVQRTVAPLTRDTLAALASPCRTCTRWELDAVHRSRLVDDADGLAAKEAWLSSTLLEWGSCGQVARVDGQVVGYVLYAPPAYLPGLAAYATAPVAGDAVAMATLRVEPEHAGRGLARMLLQAMTADLARRGVRAVEAVASSTGDDPCLVPADLLLAVGFTTVRAHPRHPRLRLDLRTTVAAFMRDDLVEAALERLVGRGRVPGLPAGSARGAHPGLHRAVGEEPTA